MPDRRAVLQIHPGAGVGPNADGYERPARVPPEIVECLGTTRPAPPWVTTDRSYRRMYYFASYRFVKCLIERGGMALFMKLYDAKDTEAELPVLYGASRQELIRQAGL